MANFLKWIEKCYDENVLKYQINAKLLNFIQQKIINSNRKKFQDIELVDDIIKNAFNQIMQQGIIQYFLNFVKLIL